MKLFLDSSQIKKVIVRLDDAEYLADYDSPQDQDVLGFISNSLISNGKTLADLTTIEVNPGPGSFTGTRVGVAIANALAFALNITVNGQKPPVLPIYSSPPNITIKI